MFKISVYFPYYGNEGYTFDYSVLFGRKRRSLKKVS